MSSAFGADAQPLLVRLRDVADAEHARKEQADAVVALAERALAEAREAQRMAAERHLAALAVVHAADDYIARFDTGTPADADPQDPGPDQAPPQSETAPGRPVNHLIIDVLELGHSTPLKTIYDGVMRVRPDVSGGAIRGWLTKLRQSGVVETVSRGVYRLIMIPEDYQADA